MKFTILQDRKLVLFIVNIPEVIQYSEYDIKCDYKDGTKGTLME